MTEAPERIWATEDADLYTITICAYEAGRAEADNYWEVIDPEALLERLILVSVK